MVTKTELRLEAFAMGLGVCWIGQKSSTRIFSFTAKLYCQQLDRLKEVIAQKQLALANTRGIVVHQGNVRPHTSIVARQKFRELG